MSGAKIQEAKSYTESRQIPQLFEGLLAGLMSHQPESHLDFLIDRLTELRSNPQSDLTWENLVPKNNVDVLPAISGGTGATGASLDTDNKAKEAITIDQENIASTAAAETDAKQSNLTTSKREGDGDKPLGVSIEFIRKLLADHPDIAAEDLTTSNINRRHVKNESAGTNRAYIHLYDDKVDENGKPFIGPSTVFVSHAWRYCFVKEVVDVMEQHALENPNAYFWYDLFTNDQNNVVNKDYEWFSATFRGAIKSIGKVLLVMSPWDNPKPLTRAWCLFEISSTLDMAEDVKFEAMLPNSQAQSLEEGVRKDPKCILQALADIQAEKAQAAVQEDRDTIFSVIERSDGGFAHINEQIKIFLRDWYEKTLTNLLEQTDNYDINLCGQVSYVMTNFGQFEKSLECSFKALSLSQAHLGENHEDTASAYNNIGETYRTIGELDDALKYLKKALAIHEALDDRSAKYASTLNNVGLVYQNKGEPEEAIKHYEHCLELRLALPGEGSQFVAESYNNIGMVYCNKGDMDKALEYYHKALPIQLETLGDNHSVTGMTYVNIGAANLRKGDFDSALEGFMKGLQINKAVLGVNHPITGTIYNNIGAVYFEKRELDKSLEYYIQALAIREATLSESHSSIATTCHNIGKLYEVKENHEKAIEYFKRELPILQALFGEVHPKLIPCYEDLVNMYSSLKDWTVVIKYYHKILDITRATVGENHPNVAEVYNSIGTAHFLNGDLEKAVEFNLKTLAIREATLGETHPDTQQSCYQLSIVCSKLGMMEKSVEYFNRSQPK